jgi:hypothetical protein
MAPTVEVIRSSWPRRGCLRHPTRAGPTDGHPARPIGMGGMSAERRVVGRGAGCRQRGGRSAGLNVWLVGLPLSGRLSAHPLPGSSSCSGLRWPVGARLRCGCGGGCRGTAGVEGNEPAGVRRDGAAFPDVEGTGLRAMSPACLPRGGPAGHCLGPWLNDCCAQGTQGSRPPHHRRPPRARTPSPGSRRVLTCLVWLCGKGDFLIMNE